MPKKFTVQDRTHLVQSAAIGHVETVRAMLEKGISPDTASHVGTALSAAAAKGQIAVMELLVEFGAKINTRIEFGIEHDRYGTALNAALANGQVSAAHWLLSRGAEPRMLDPLKNSPPALLLLRAERSGFVKPSDELVLETLSKMLDAGASVNRQQRVGGASLLHIACGNESVPIEVISFLLSRGADPTVLDSKGVPPAHLAADKGFAHRLVALLDAGMSVDIQDVDGRTLLHTIADEGMVDLIHRYRPNPEVRDDEGRTPLRYWVSQIKEPGQVPYPVTKLLQAGASLDTPDYAGVTARDIVKAQKLTALLALEAASKARHAMDNAIGKSRTVARPFN